MKLSKHICAFIAALSLVSCAPAFTGCKSSPNQIAYKTTAATVASVDSAMQAWAQYVVTERRRTANDPAAAAKLRQNEDTVRYAYGKYQSAIAAAGVGVAVADNSPVVPEVSGAAAALISVIQANVKN